MQHGGPGAGRVDIRERVFPRIGFVVDGGVADALEVEFETESTTGLRVARTYSGGGVEIIIVRRNRTHAMPYDLGSPEPIELLAKLKVRQVVSIVHQLLVHPPSSHSDEPEALTVALIQQHACTRLLTATFDQAENHAKVDGVFLREATDDFNLTLHTEVGAARRATYCVAAIEATTLRSDIASTKSEETLAEILLAIPDAISPLASCRCLVSSGFLPSQK